MRRGYSNYEMRSQCRGNIGEVRGVGSPKRSLLWYERGLLVRLQLCGLKLCSLELQGVVLLLLLLCRLGLLSRVCRLQHSLILRLLGVWVERSELCLYRRGIVRGIRCRRHLRRERCELWLKLLGLGLVDREINQVTKQQQHRGQSAVGLPGVEESE